MELQRLLELFTQSVMADPDLRDFAPNAFKRAQMDDEWKDDLQNVKPIRRWKVMNNFKPRDEKIDEPPKDESLVLYFLILFL